MGCLPSFPLTEDELAMPSHDETALLQDIQDKREALAACPRGHPDRSQLATSLGNRLFRGYQRIGDMDMINEAIKVEREALALRPKGHPDRSRSCCNLGASICELYRQTGDVILLMEAVELNREALALEPSDHPQRTITCANLGALLHTRYQFYGDIDALHESIELGREALRLRPAGHHERASACSDLAIALDTCYLQGGDLTLLDEAINLGREALVLRPVGHPKRAISCASLGRLLQTRYKQCADIFLLDEATELYREALDLQPTTHPHRGHSYSQLATALRVLYDQCGSLDVLDETIILHRKALALRPPGHPDRPLSCSNLGGSLDALYDQCGDLTLLDEAIDLKREALDLQPPHHPERASCSANLGSSLFMRYLQCSDLALLNEAIALQRVALELQPPCHTELAFSHAILGSYLYELYRRRGDISMLHEAIELQRKAIALQPTSHAQRASICGSLGISLHEYYHQCGDPTVLDDAIKLEREALDLRPIGHLKRAGSCTDLSLALMDSYRRNNNDDLLDEVVEMSRHVLENGSSTEVSSMFMLLAGLHLIHSSPHFSTSDALRCLDGALESGVSSIHSHISNLDYTLSLLWELSSMWNHDIPSLLCSVYIKAIDRLPLAASFVLETPARLENLATTSHIGSDGCIAAVLAERPTTAIELLDRAHGLVWTQALHHRDPQMEGPPPELVDELTGLLSAISVPTPTYLDESSRPTHYQDHRHKKNTRIQALLREIRAMPGLGRFMLGSTYETLRQAAHEHAVVVLVAGRVHVLALVVTNADEDVPHVLHLELTSDELSGLRGAAEKSGFRSRALTQDYELETRQDMRGMQPGNMGLSNSPSDVLATLWRQIVEPIIDHCDCRSRQVGRALVFTGIYKGPPANQVCCSDYAVSSYTPTISALLRAQALGTSVASTQVNMLLVGEDCTSDPTMSSLRGVQKELAAVALIAARFRHDVETMARAATVERVTARVKAASFVHLACHGIQDPKSALESGFHLSDGRLTISKLMEVKLERPWLAYLSACETAKGDAKQPDQVMHLAAAMLFTGFKHVVATMWVMNDDDGPDLAKWFYEELMSSENIDADAVAYALDEAVRKLRAKEPSPNRWAQFVHIGA